MGFLAKPEFTSLALLWFSCIIVYQSIYFLPQQAFHQYSFLGKPEAIIEQEKDKVEYSILGLI